MSFRRHSSCFTGRKIWILRLITLSLTLLISVATAEICLRVILTGNYRGSLNNLPKKTPDDITKQVSYSNIIQVDNNLRKQFRLRPGARGIFMGVPVEISQQGLRDDWVEIPKPAETFRILGLGDSATFGWGVSRVESYLELLQDDLQRQANEFPGNPLHVELVNCGTPGYTTVQEVEMFKDVGLSMQPDVVLIQFDRNDLEAPIGSIRPDFLYTHKFLMGSIPQILNGTLSDTRAFIYLDQRDRLKTPTPFSGWEAVKNAYEELSKICRERDIPLYAIQIFEDQPSLIENSNLDPDHQKMLNIWKELDIPAIQVASVGKALLRRENFLNWREAVISAVDPHPNSAGHAIIAEALYPTLNAELRRHAGLPPARPSEDAENAILRQFSQKGLYPAERRDGRRLNWVWWRCWFDFVPTGSRVQIPICTSLPNISPSDPLRLTVRIQGFPMLDQPDAELEQVVQLKDHEWTNIEFDLSSLQGMPLHFGIEADRTFTTPEDFRERSVMLGQFSFFP